MDRKDTREGRGNGTGTNMKEKELHEQREAERASTLRTAGSNLYSKRLHYLANVLGLA